MGLFDNLFLDANTPVTINDGVDHSKDVVQSIVDPTFVEPVPGSISGTADGITGEKKDDSLVDLFGSEKKEEVEAAEVLNPEPPKDIALEIGYSSPEMSADPAVSFDIGGDLLFDIGGNIVAGPADATTSSGGTDAISTIGNIEVTSTEELAPGLSAVLDSQAGGSTDVVSGVNPGVSVGENTSNNTLFALLNDTPSASDVSVGQGDIPNTNSVTVSPTSSESISSAFPSLLGESVPDGGILSQLEGSHEPGMGGTGNGGTGGTGGTGNGGTGGTGGTGNGGTGGTGGTGNGGTGNGGTGNGGTGNGGTGNGGTGGTGVTDITGVVTHDVNSLSFPGDTDSHEYSHTSIGHLSSSSKLKSKLAEFLSELESMEFGDESQKAHKLQQIEMCRMRIAEIRREYDSRIHALQGEMQVLEQEIRDMDGEKTHIKTVIEAFQKELDIA